jgi:hypothetical protein
MRTLEVRSQKSEVRIRRGNSIVEVLFAILIATIGLLGAVAVFPVANATARRGQVNDATAAAARDAVHVVDSRGMRRPDMWGAWDRFSTTTPINSKFVKVKSLSVNPPVGTAVCIDPRFIAVNMQNSKTANLELTGWATSYFPYYGPPTLLPPANPTPTNPPTPPISPTDPRMLRVTLDGLASRTNSAGIALTYGMWPLMAESVFSVEDDLTILRSTDRSQPATQVFDYFPLATGLPSTTASRRLSNGHMSWMATLVPKIDLYANLNTDEYVLSIVVFYDRPADMTVGDQYHERVVYAAFPPGADGSTGGEVLLHWNYSATPTSASNEVAAKILKVRSNDWLLLSGFQFYTVGLKTFSFPRFQWYRVTHCDHEPTYVAPSLQPQFAATPGYEVYATLMGQDWDPNVGLYSGVAVAAQVQQAALITGVVGVYEKTVRLDTGVAP